MILQEISNRTVIEIANIQRAYRKQIVASQAFGYISIACIVVLPALIILNDLGKLHNKRSFERLLKRIQKLRAAKRTALAREHKDGLKMCESIQKTRKQLSDFDSLFLKSLVNMHAQVVKKKSH